MDSESEYMPRTAREKVMIYMILSELDNLTYSNSSKILGILSDSRNIPKEDIKNWITKWHNILSIEDVIK